MQWQGVLTRTQGLLVEEHGENSLKRFREATILGVLRLTLIPAKPGLGLAQDDKV